MYFFSFFIRIFNNFCHYLVVLQNLSNFHFLYCSLKFWYCYSSFFLNRYFFFISLSSSSIGSYAHLPLISIYLIFCHKYFSFDFSLALKLQRNCLRLLLNLIPLPFDSLLYISHIFYIAKRKIFFSRFSSFPS